MKFYILTEAGTNYGYGHVSRCSSLYCELAKRNYDVELIINGDKEVEDVIHDKKHSIINWLSMDYLSRILQGKEYVIVDSYLADLSMYNFISSNAKKALFIDDTIRLDYPKGIVVNPSIYSKELNYPKKKGIEYLLGPDYVLLREPFLDCKKDHFRNVVKEVLITLGGSDIVNLTPKILMLLTKEFPNLKKNVIIGKGFSNIKQIEEICDQNVNLFFNVDGKKMSELMVNSDLAITAAGQTIYELIKTNTPFIPIQVSENQSNNVGALLKYRIVNEVLNSEDEDIITKLLEEIRLLINLDNRKFFINSIKGLIDGLGSARIVNKMIEE